MAKFQKKSTAHNEETSVLFVTGEILFYILISLIDNQMKKSSPSCTLRIHADDAVDPLYCDPGPFDLFL